MTITKSTYRKISFGFLALFLSLLFAPTLILVSVDNEVDISVFYSFAEEETKEHEIEFEGEVDDLIAPEHYMFYQTINGLFFFQDGVENNIVSLFDPGIIVPPPELI